jgi:hypothetical protein
MKTPSRFAFACAYLFVALPTLAQGPDPVALLRGAEAARQAIHSGEIEFTIVQTWQTRKPVTADVRVTFDGTRRTIRLEQDEFTLAGNTPAESEASGKRYAAVNYDMDKAAAIGAGRKEHWRTSQAYDGSQFCKYHAIPHGNASYRKMEVDGEMTFNPQTLGLVEIYHLVLDLSFFFSNSQAKNITLVGREFVGDVPTWHVRYDAIARCHFWIEDREPFRVHNVEYEGIGKDVGYRTTIISTFKDDGSPLPARVLVKKVTPSRTDLESTLTVSSAKLNMPVNPHVGTLASLELPEGVYVVDAIEHKSLGIWDGEKIVPSEEYQKRRSVSRRFGRQQILFGTAATGLFAGAIAYLWWRHRRLVRQQSPSQSAGGPQKPIHF